jgi:hypothetical protein
MPKTNTRVTNRRVTNRRVTNRRVTNRKGSNGRGSRRVRNMRGGEATGTFWGWILSLFGLDNWWSGVGKNDPYDLGEEFH